MVCTVTRGITEICPLFHYLSERPILFFTLWCNFAGDIAPYICGKNLDFILTKLKEHSVIATEWFEKNHMKINSDKCHLFILGNKIWTFMGQVKKAMMEYGKIEQSNS